MNIRNSADKNVNERRERVQVNAGREDLQEPVLSYLYEKTLFGQQCFASWPKKSENSNAIAAPLEQQQREADIRTTGEDQRGNGARESS
jgi:hypothetical protein